MLSINRVDGSRLQGKRCIVTGAGRGIGLAIAQAFLSQGAQVVISDKNSDLAEREARRLGCEYLVLDVSKEADWELCADRYPAIDVLVNNAAITGLECGSKAHDPEHASLADWRMVHDTNLDGVFLGCRYAIKAMRVAGKGAIVNISSRSGLVGIPLAAAYASSKAAVRNHSKTVALYCAEQGLNIRCNSIHPAAILTPMWEPMLGQGAEREKNMKSLVAQTPMQRFGRPEEVAAVAVLLASDEASYMNGAELNIDGGMLAGSITLPE